MEWIYIRHPDAGETRVPAEDGVLASYQARGWEQVDAPDEDAQVFVPPKAVEKNERDGWVTLYHPETHAVHDFPSHPDAVQGAYESGWQATPPKALITPKETSDPHADTVDPTTVEDEGYAKTAKSSKTRKPTANEDPADADPAIEDEDVTRA